MSITISNIERVNPAPCKHWRITLDRDGVQTVSVEMHESELTGALELDDVKSVFKAWAKYQRSKGITPQQMVGAAIFSKVVT